MSAQMTLEELRKLNEQMLELAEQLKDLGETTRKMSEAYLLLLALIRAGAVKVVDD